VPSERTPPPPFKAPSRARVLRIRARLQSVYGIPAMAPHGHPIAELVLTVLSQSTNDRNRDVAYLRMRKRFPSWRGVRDCPTAALEEAIRPGGISRVKSARIQAILHAISADPRDPPHELSLDWMRRAPLLEAREYLLALPGVGRKTAACVLLFAFGRREVPVDTHVGRVGARLALLPAAGSAEALHDQMLALTPPGAELELHVNLLRHGRRTCHARAPSCERCALARMCPSAHLFRAAAQPRGSTAKAITA
jgi:endonuclease-3